MKKVFIVFYSRSGATRKMAENLRDKLITKGFEVVTEELLDQKKRKGFWGYLIAGFDAYRKKTTTLALLKEEKVGSYDLVIIGSPLWANTMAPAVRTFLNSYAAKMKKVAFFCASGGKHNLNIFKQMQELSSQFPLGFLTCRKREILKDSADYQNEVERFCQEIEKGI